MSASPEFVTLCRAQIALLTQGLGASLSIVYLTEGLTSAEEANLVPVVAYPEAAASWERSQILSLLSGGLRNAGAGAKLPSSSDLSAPTENLPLALPASALSPTEGAAYSDQTNPSGDALSYTQQIVLPLVHEGVMMGLLVTARSDRPWFEPEQAQVERIARTLAIACVLDQRSQWAEHEAHQQQLLQSQQHDIFDDLLHQFRNPLTALRTFGKLLLRRLVATDENRSVAEGIVRESDRLQDLLLQFETAIDLGEADLLPAGSDAPPVSWEAEVETTPDRQPKPPQLLRGANYLTGAQLQLEPHTFIEILEPLLTSAMAIAQERQLNLQANIPANLPPICADLKALREVLNNLIDNALKYTPPGQQVWVLAGIQRSPERDPMQAIAIIDSGPGIPAEDLPHLFQRHFRGVQAAGSIPGTGLGLAIAHDLIHQMHGEIQVFSPAHTSGLISQNLPLGTAFVVWLPEVHSGG